jgi:hypothetical protein
MRAWATPHDGDKQLSQIVHRQAVVMGYGDAFFILTVFYFGWASSWFKAVAAVLAATRA